MVQLSCYPTLRVSKADISLLMPWLITPELAPTPAGPPPPQQCPQKPSGVEWGAPPAQSLCALQWGKAGPHHRLLQSRSRIQHEPGMDFAFLPFPQQLTRQGVTQPLGWAWHSDPMGRPVGTLRVPGALQGVQGPCGHPCSSQRKLCGSAVLGKPAEVCGVNGRDRARAVCVTMSLLLCCRHCSSETQPGTCTDTIPGRVGLGGSTVAPLV